jgi:hypothetical protein
MDDDIIRYMELRGTLSVSHRNFRFAASGKGAT